MASYKLTPAAESDLELIWGYTAERWGINQANRYVDDLAAAFDLLAESPALARLREEFAPSVRIHPHAHHLIVFIEAEGGIVIVRVLHESMDVDAQLES